jgi:hypothetical protein
MGNNNKKITLINYLYCCIDLKDSLELKNYNDTTKQIIIDYINIQINQIFRKMNINKFCYEEIEELRLIAYSTIEHDKIKNQVF